MLDTRVFTLGVLANQNSVNAIVWGFVSGDRATWTDVGEEVESAAKSQIERDVALSNRGLNHMLEPFYRV